VHCPFPEACEAVLLSPDLLLWLFGWFELEHHAVKSVCKAWRGAWAATLEGRRALRPGPELVAPWESSFGLAGATPDGERLVLEEADDGGAVDGTLHIIDRQMESKASLPATGNAFAIGQDFLIGTRDQTLRRYSFSGELLATYEHAEEGFFLAFPALSPCCLLFCLCCNEDDDTHDTPDEILVFDSNSLQLQRRFGKGLLKGVQGLTVGGDALYVCDCDRDCIRVFSFTGELLRTIRGEWRRPCAILCMRDRLYLTELHWDFNEVEVSRPEGYSPEIQRRVFVMSLAGEALQTYAPELEGGQRLSDNMAVFGENLVLVGGESKLIALKGL